jgi:uracil-DNA glycosylase
MLFPGVAGKYERLNEPHVEPLNSLVRVWRTERATTRIPWFDPDDGGVHARILILMESPAPATVSETGGGVCSEDNVDVSNRTLSTLRTATGISRSVCVKWNMVPWGINEPGRPVSTPSRSDIETAVPYLLQVLALARSIDVVVTLGNVATAGFMRATAAADARRLYRVVSAPHPSQRNAAARSQALDRISHAFRLVANHIGGAQ